MRLGIFAKTFPGQTPAAVFVAAAQAGYSAIQYNMACSGLAAMPDEIPEAAARAVSAAALGSGVTLAAVSGTYNMIHPDRRLREDGLRRLEILAARCRAMGTRLLTLCTGTRDPEDQWRHHPDNAGADAWRDLTDAMARAITIAERHDIDLGIEPELANVVCSAEAARRLLDEMRSPRLKIVLDAANLFEKADLNEQRRIVGAAVDRLADRIVIAHAKDRDAGGGFVAAGQGVLDYRHYLACLGDAGFAGPLITHGLAAGQARRTAAFLRNAMADAGLGVA